MKGIIPRMVEHLFSRISNATDKTEFELKVSMIEIYNEKVRDLLNPKNRNYLEVKQIQDDLVIKGKKEHIVLKEEDVRGLIELGNKSRTTAATKMNDTSSRSHSIFMI